MGWIEVTVVAAVVVGVAVLVDRARHPARYAALRDEAWIKRWLVRVSVITTLAALAAAFGGSAIVVQVIVAIGLIALVFLTHAFIWAHWFPNHR